MSDCSEYVRSGSVQINIEGVLCECTIDMGILLSFSMVLATSISNSRTTNIICDQNHMSIPTQELPVTPGDAFELVEQLVRRACALPPEESPLQVDKLEVADYIFQLSQYHHPDNITLPAGYVCILLCLLRFCSCWKMKETTIMCNYCKLI